MNKLITVILILFLLSACGQKGPLYLQDKVPEKPKAVFTTKTSTIQPDKISLKPLKIVTAQVQMQKNNTPAWQAVLVQSEDSVNLTRYVIFTNDLLGDPPYQLSVGQARPIDKKIKIDNNIKQISMIEDGLYLRFRSLERGLNHIPALIAAAKTYLQQHPEIHRRFSARDFLTENRQNIDLFIAIERTPE